ncbi:MAG: sensor histidine kinase [Flavobacteriales bacterium]|nr:sensor histidine kinase [Flavobacteriales bacterium]
MKILRLLFLLLVLSNSLFSQSKKDSLVIQIEDYLLEGKNDSALMLIEVATGIEENHRKYLRKIALHEVTTGKDYYAFIVQVQQRRSQIEYTSLSAFIDREIREPKGEAEVDLAYTKIKRVQITELRNRSFIDEATAKNDLLLEYVQSFDTSKVTTKKAKLHVENHLIVMHQIQRDVEKGKAMSLRNETIARQINDTSLIILSLYQQSDFLIIEGKLDEYIAVCEKSFNLDCLLEKKSSHYFAILSHLIDAYIYKGGNDKRVRELLDLLYENENFHTEAISFYAKFLRYTEKGVTDIQFILDRFEVDNVKDFANKAIELTQHEEEPNLFFHVINEFAHTLNHYGYYDESADFFNRAIGLTKKIYSEDLSKSLADFETKQIRKEKEVELAHERDQTQLYGLIATLVLVLLIILIFAFVRKRKKASLLAEKNKQIETALHEKQLLLKEVHHRVKNNFRIISSLLELQSKGIEDEKAKELAHEGRNRVKSMALIHQKLYQNDDLLIYFDDYIDKLVKEISGMYGAENKTVISIQVAKIAFDIDTAIPLGLIVNELVTNAFKYGVNHQKVK